MQLKTTSPDLFVVKPPYGLVKPMSEAAVTIVLKGEVPRDGKQKFQVQAATTPLSQVSDIAAVLKTLHDKAVSHSLVAVFLTEDKREDAPFSPDSKKSMQVSIRTSTVDLNPDRHATVQDLKRLKSQLLDEKALLQTRMAELQAEAKRNYLQSKDLSTEEPGRGYGALHLAIVLLLGLWIGLWARK